MAVQPQYDLGPSFAGLPQTSSQELCAPDPRQTFDATNMPSDTATVPYFLTTYGTCDATSEEGCAPPLAVETWPICADNLSGNPSTGGFDDQAASTQTLVTLLSRLHQTVRTASPAAPASSTNDNALATAAGQVQVASFGGEADSSDASSMEAYVGTTTIRVFSDDPSLVSPAVAALSSEALVARASQGLSSDAIATSVTGQGCAA